jgi:hypothetical protein
MPAEASVPLSMSHQPSFHIVTLFSSSFFLFVLAILQHPIRSQAYEWVDCNIN